LREEKDCTGEGSGFQELEEKRAEAKIAHLIVQIPLMEFYDLQPGGWRRWKVGCGCWAVPTICVGPITN
jgi:hypothetical protein